MMNVFKKTRRGASMVEYAVLLGAITLVALVGISFLGNKTADIIGALATTLPGANADDDLSIISHELVELTEDVGNNDDYVRFDASIIGANDAGNRDNRLATNTGYDPTELEALVTDLIP